MSFGLLLALFIISLLFNGVLIFAVVNLYKKQIKLENFVASFHDFVVQILHDIRLIDNEGLFERANETSFLWEDIKKTITKIEAFK